MSALPSTTTFDEYLNEQLINCLNLQTNVIQNLAQYSQHISLQLIEIKNNVNILANRILTLQQQQEQQSYMQMYPPPPNPLLFYHSLSELMTKPPPPFAFSSTTNEQISHIAPFVFDPINSNNVITHSDEDDEDYDDDDDDDDYSYEPTIPFRPNVQLPAVEIQTNEQAKLFNKSKEIKGDLLSIGNISLNDDDIILIGEMQPTTEQIEQAKKLQLPLTFYLYENKKPCKGCRGCKDDLLSPSSIISNFPSAFFPNSSLPSLMSMTSTWLPGSPVKQMPSPPKDYRMIIKAKRCLPSNRLPPPSSHSTYEQPSPEFGRGDDVTATQAHQKKSRNFSGYNTESNLLDNYATKMVENILDRAKQELHKQIVTTKDDNTKPSISENSGFSFTNFGNKTTSINDFQFSPKTTDTSSKIIFGNTPKLSFSDLVKQSAPIIDNNNTEERVFPGQGSLIFGTNTKDEGDADDSYEPTITFKPIVKLFPVEVKTGEEDENILFCERAKLYRFDSSTNQMKERGIGEMKILQHKTTKLCRVLMRREQVLKVCANHKITSQLELKPHKDSENAYIWSAIDFADREAKHETLCVKFKTSDIAKRFFQQFNDAKIEQ